MSAPVVTRERGFWGLGPLPPPSSRTIPQVAPAELGAVGPHLAESPLPLRGVIWNSIPSGRKWEILEM